MTGNGGNQGWKDWTALVPGQLRREIEEACGATPAGTYKALEIKIENPITEYRIIITPA